MRSVIGAAAVSGLLFLQAATSGAVSMEEYFNDYGASDVSLSGLNGGNGWGGAWAASGADPFYVSLANGAGNNLSYPGSYNSENNQSDSVGAGADGASGDNGGTITNVADRSVGSLTGTVWISALARYDSETDGVYLWLDASDLFGIEAQQAVVDYGSGLVVEGAGADDDDVAGTDPVFAADTTHLLLARVVMNSPGTVDSIRFWVDPPLDGTEAGLGAPLFDRTGTNALGGGITAVGIAFSGAGGRIDAIRVSNDAEGLVDVTGMIDDFADNVTDTSFWSVINNGSGVTVQETNQRVEVSLAADAGGDPFMGGYLSNAVFSGDVDIAVSFSLPDWPATNGVRVGLALVTDPAFTSFWTMTRVSGGAIEAFDEVYLTDFDTSVGTFLSTSDTTGALRIARSGDTFFACYLANGTWHLLRSDVVPSVGDLHLVFAAWSHDAYFGNQPVKVAFDDVLSLPEPGTGAALICGLALLAALRLGTKAARRCCQRDRDELRATIVAAPGADLARDRDWRGALGAGSGAFGESRCTASPHCSRVLSEPV